MRRAWLLAVLIMSVIALTGCPFESSVPLGPPSGAAFDTRLLGEWSQTRPDGSVGIVAVTAAGGSIADVELHENGGEPERLRAWLVTVGGQHFLNIDERKGGASPGPFVFARYAISDADVLTLRFVGDKAIAKPVGDDQKQLVKFVATHLEGNDLDAGAEAFSLHRAPPKSP